MSKFKVGDHVMHITQGSGVVVCVLNSGILILVEDGRGTGSIFYEDLCKNLDADKSYWLANERYLTKINTFKGNV